MLPNLTIRQLQSFREVMRSGSISEASRVLGRTQPAVSSTIANLEQQLGFPLFLREHGRLTPCPEAHYFLEETEEVLTRLDRTARAMAEFGAQERGNLRIACHPAASGFFIPALLSDFLKDRHKVKVDLTMRSSQIVTDLIASQEFDIGLAETPPPRGSILCQTWDLECVLALPAKDPLAQKPLLTPSDLHGYPFATLFDEHPTWHITDEAFRQYRAKLNRRFVLRTFLPALQLVASGLCASLVDRITAATCPTPGIVFRQFAPAVVSGISILQPAHRPTSLLSDAFRDALAVALDKIGTGMPGTNPF